MTDVTLQIKVDSTDVTKAKKSLDDLASASASATTSTDRLSDTTSELGSSAKAAGNEVDANTKKIDNSYKTMGGSVASSIGKVVAALGLMQVGRMFADTVMETEKLRGALTTMTGSTANAAAAFENLTKFASETPFTLDQSVNAFIKLKALGLDPSERALQSYGNTASAMGKDMMQMIEAVADASTGEFERLKEFGIKAKSEGDNVALTFQGVTTTIGKNSEEIQAYLLAIGEVQFAGAMENQMQRLPGLMSNLQDNIDGLFRKLGDSGGINLFGKAISLASGAVLLLTDNLDLIGTALGAAGAAFAVLAAPAAILGGIAMIQKAVIAMNAAILANPIALVAAAIGAAAFVIYKHWDTITDAAEKSALAVEIAFAKLKLFLMDTFSPILTDISGMFTSARNTAVATMEAISAAAKNPTSAIETFNTTFDNTLTRLVAGQTETAVFSGAISQTRASIVQMEQRLTEMNTTTADSVSVLTDAATATDTATLAVEEMTVAEDDLTLAIMAKITELEAEREALHLSERELFILNATKLKGVELTAEQSVGIRDAAAALFDEREQMKENEKAQKAINDAREKGIEFTKNLIIENGREEIQLVLNERQQAIYNAVMRDGITLTGDQMKAIESSINSLYDQRDATAAVTAEAERNKGSIELWTKLSTAGSEQRAAAEVAAQKKQEEAIARTHEYLTTSFIDIFNNGKNAFDNIAKAFSTMIQRMLAEWAASKLMNLIGMGDGTAVANPFAALGSAFTNAISGGGGGATGTVANAAASKVASSIVGGSGGSLLAAGGQFASGLTGSAVGAGSALAGPPTAAAAAGSGVVASIGAGVKAVGSAISGGASAAGAFVMANPLLAAAALAAAAAAALAKKPTTSSNAGLLIHDAPGASADRKFAVDAFASGFAPVGFARREDQASANEVIDVFRKYDASLTEIAKAAGLNVNFSNNPFGGFDEKGQGNGLFLGTAAEEGKGVTSAPISEQLTQFTKQWVEALGGQVSPADREFLLSSGSADVLLERAATLGQAERGRLDGIGFGGIRNVPFNGFRAELHKGEEVLTASDPRNRNNGGMMSEMRDMLTEMRNMAFYTKRTADLLLRVTRDGDSLVTVAA